MFGNAWSNPLVKPIVPKLKIQTYTRENDLTFSFGKVVDYDHVVGLLLESGCVEPKTMLDEIKMLKITKSVHNGQVFVTCAKPGVCDEWVKKLNSMDGTSIQKCHSYSDKEVTVRFSFIHPSVNIQKDIVEKFLIKYGPVKEWSALKDKKYGIPNGSYVFIMQEEDLAKKPLPEYIFLNHVQCFISYRTQVVICHNCGNPGHIAVDCPRKNDLFPTLHGPQNGRGVFLPGKVPRGPRHNRPYGKNAAQVGTAGNDGTTDVLAHLSTQNDSHSGSPLEEAVSKEDGGLRSADPGDVNLEDQEEEVKNLEDREEEAKNLEDPEEEVNGEKMNGLWRRSFPHLEIMS